MATVAPSGRSPEAGAPTASEAKTARSSAVSSCSRAPSSARGRLGQQVGVDVGSVLEPGGIGGRLCGRRLLELRLGRRVGGRSGSIGAAVGVCHLESGCGGRDLGSRRRCVVADGVAQDESAGEHHDQTGCSHAEPRRRLRPSALRRAAPGDDMAATPAAAAPSAPVGVESRSAPVRSLSGSRSQASSAAARCRSRIEIGALSLDDACDTMARTVRRRSTSARSSADASTWARSSAVTSPSRYALARMVRSSFIPVGLDAPGRRRSSPDRPKILAAPASSQSDAAAAAGRGATSRPAGSGLARCVT